MVASVHMHCGFTLKQKIVKSDPNKKGGLTESLQHLVVEKEESFVFKEAWLMCEDST